jgi:hypothetical protein
MTLKEVKQKVESIDESIEGEIFQADRGKYGERIYGRKFTGQESAIKDLCQTIISLITILESK